MRLCKAGNSGIINCFLQHFGMGTAKMKIKQKKRRRRQTKKRECFKKQRWHKVIIFQSLANSSHPPTQRSDAIPQAMDEIMNVPTYSRPAPTHNWTAALGIKWTINHADFVQVINTTIFSINFNSSEATHPSECSHLIPWWGTYSPLIPVGALNTASSPLTPVGVLITESSALTPVGVLGVHPPLEEKQR